MNKNIYVTIVAREPQRKQSRKEVDVKFERSPRPNPLADKRLSPSTAQIARHERRKAQPKPKQLSLWQPQQKPETAPYLQIASIPVDERVNRFEHRYCLVILPYGVRACGGQFTADEVYQVAQATKRWDWSLDEAGRLRCLPALEALLDSICKRSYQKGGECNA